MSITREELDHFHRFATDQILQPEPPLDLDELLMRWRDFQDRSQIRAIIEQRLAQLDAGEPCRPARDVTDEICQKLGIPTP